MEHILDPKTMSTRDIIETSQPGFIATMELAMYERRGKYSLEGQKIKDILFVMVGSKAKVHINVKEIRRNGKEKKVSFTMSWNGSIWTYNRRWSTKARIIAWSGEEKF